MRKCLLDTNSFSILMYDSIPEKWSRIWREIRMRQRTLLLFEPLVSEMYYKNIPKYGKKEVKDKILRLKALQTEVYSLDDNDALNAGAIKEEYARYAYH